MGQKVSADLRRKRKEKKAPKTLRFKTPPQITFRHLGIKDSQLRIVDKTIPIPATKDGTQKERRHWEYCAWIKRMFTEAKAHPLFRSKENTYDELDDDHDEYEIDITEENWNRNIHTHMAVYALVISASNIFRFPDECYRYGGVVFFMAYAFVSLVVIRPIIYLEMVVGQFSQTAVAGFGALHIFAKGIPLAIVFMSLVFVSYNSVVLGYTGKYVFGAFYTQPGNCNGSWNSLSSCVSYDDIQRFQASPSLMVKDIWLETPTLRTSLISTELYFRQFILHQRWDGQSNPVDEGWNPYLFIGLGFTYILVFISIRVRLTSLSSKIIIILSALLPLLLVCLFISQVFRMGALAGIAQLFFFQIRDWGNLLSFQFWCEVSRCAFLTTGVGCGLYSRVASKNPFNKDSLYFSSWVVVTVTLFISLISTFIVMSELGALRHIFSGSTYDTIFAESTGSAFAAVSGALLVIDQDNRAGSFIFFGVCNICGIWSQVVATENCTTQIVNWFSIATHKLQFARYIALIIVIGLQAAIALLVSKAGGLMLDSFLFDGTWAAAFVSLAEVVSIGYMYGTVFFMIDIELMLRHSAPRFFKFELRYSSPIAILVMLIALSYANIRYGEESYLGIIPVPDFVVYTGYVFNAIPPLLILLLAWLGVFQKKQKGLFWVPAIDYLKDIFGRFLNRRNAFCDVRLAHVHTITAEAIQRLKQTERAASLKGLRAELTRVLRSQKARANWLRLGNQVMMSERLLNSMPRVSNCVLREMELRRTRKEVKYVRKILRNYSMECIFTVPKEVHPRLVNKGRERDRLAHVLLNSLPLDELGFHYPELTLYERLVGKSNPIPEEDKANLMVRIKRHLGIECTRDANVWLRLMSRLEENRKKNTVFREDTPIEFHFEGPSQQRIRVIMFKGLDHSILINTPLPRPRMVQVVSRHLRQRAGRALWTYLKDIVTREIVNEQHRFSTVGLMKMDLIQKRKNQWPNKRLADKDPQDGHATDDRVSTTRNSHKDHHEPTHSTDVRTSERRQLFTPLENWYHNCDTRRYKITPINTFFVVVLDRHALKEMVKDRFALILQPEHLPKPREVVQYNSPGVYEVTYASIRPFLQKMAEREELLTRPTDGCRELSLPEQDDSDEEFGLPLSKRKGPHRDGKFSVGVPQPEAGPHPADLETRRFSEIDIYMLRRLHPAVSTILPPEKRFSDSVIAELRKKELTGEMKSIPNPFESAAVSTTARKGRRTVVQSTVSEDWVDSHVLTTRWKTSDEHLVRTKSELYSEKSMAMWVSEIKGKAKGGLNEEDKFFYRHKGNQLLIVEPRKGRFHTSTSDTAIPQIIPKKK